MHDFVRIHLIILEVQFFLFGYLYCFPIKVSWFHSPPSPLLFLKAMERLRENREQHKVKQQYLAMYSSVFGGITTDPAAMIVPIDDHMVHRGHGVFDTAAIVDGLVYKRNNKI